MVLKIKTKKNIKLKKNVLAPCNYGYNDLVNKNIR
jgi:hypothetical protein